MADAFDDGSDSEGDEEPDGRQRLMRANPEPQGFADVGGNGGDYASSGNGGNGNAVAGSSGSGVSDGVRGQDQGQPPQPQQQRQQGRGLFRTTTILPSFLTSSSGTSRAMTASNDGVFANLAAKPERGESKEDLPPVRIFLSMEPFGVGILLTRTVL